MKRLERARIIDPPKKDWSWEDADDYWERVWMKPRSYNMRGCKSCDSYTTLYGCRQCGADECARCHTPERCAAQQAVMAEILKGFRL